MTSFTPREIVSELDRHIVGQNDAKRAVAIALRNRWRRQQLEDGMRQEVLPKNILMIGPTGVGKTEIARRLANLAQAPFLKVEATKFTEIGYVGRDVEQIIRDLVEIAIHMTREKLRKQVAAKAELAAEERVLTALVGEHASAETREKFRRMLRAGELDEKEIEIQVSDSAGMQLPTFDIPGMPGAQMGMLNLSEMFSKAFGGAAEEDQADDRRRSRTTCWSPRRRTSCSTRSGWCARRSRRSRTTASSSSTRSTRSPPAPSGWAPTSAARACSATCCR